MRGGGRNRFTVFDVLEAQGHFDSNPANISSPQYNGPIEFPKMYYHPTGKMRVIQKAEILNTPYGPQKVGEQQEIIARVVHNAEEEARVKQAGWHDHPAKSIAAGGGTAPPMTAHGRIADLERQLASLQAQLLIAKEAPPPPPEEDAIEAA
jgi:hypothetical protein